MPISISRVNALGASFVWRVLNTKWPVSAARIAISAVSRSRMDESADQIASSYRRADQFAKLTAGDVHSVLPVIQQPGGGRNYAV